MKLTYCLLPLAALLMTNACSETTHIPALPTKVPVMDAYTAEMLAKAEIIQLAHAYGIARDSYDGKAYASVFAEDGVFMFRGEEFVGREAIASRVPPKDDNSEISMHFVTTSHVELTSAKTAKGKHYGAVYIGKYEEGAERVGAVPGTLASRGIYTDSYVLTDEGWKISKRAYNSVFIAADH